MPITITHLEGPLAGHALETFDDSVSEILFGRSQECDVQYPAEYTVVGNKHFKLKRNDAGDYSVQLLGKRYVGTRGSGVDDNFTVRSGTVLRLGREEDGPSFKVELQPPMRERGVTDKQDPMDDPRDRTAKLARKVAIALVGIVALGLGTMGYSHYRERSIMNGLLEATYLLVKRDPAGDEATATAFVVEKHKLATNAHVTEAIRKAPSGMFYLLSPKGKRIDIKGVDTHPAYLPFKFKKWMLGKESHGGFQHECLAGAYDIGLIETDPSSSLNAKPLQIAGPDDAVSLEQGQDVLAAGYPSEGIVGADNLIKEMSNPNYYDNSSITALKSVFLGGAQEDRNKLIIVHNIPVTGGMSGSPVVDKRSGKVIGVVSGGNIVGACNPAKVLDEKGPRTPNAAMVNFAQRADLLSEMIDRTAKNKLPAQEAYWDQAGKSFDQYDAFVRKKLMEHAQNAYGVDNPDDDRIFASGSLNPAAKGKRASRSIIFDAEPGFVYGLLAILSGDGRVRIDIGLYQDGKLLKPSEGKELANDTFAKWKADEMPTNWVRVNEPTKLEVRLSGFIDSPVDYKLYLYSWPAPVASVTKTPAWVTSPPVAPAAVPKQ